MLPSLHSLVLPEDAPIRRGLPAMRRPWDPGLEPRYDRRTVAYDVFWVPRRQAWCLVCPALLDLEPAFRAARLTVDGVPLRRRRLYRFKRYAEAWFRGPAPDPVHGAEIVLEIGGIRLATRAGTVDEASFAGRDVGVVKSKDNDLAWIADWARWHASVHGMSGVVFFDNGSTRHAPAEIEATLAGVPGIEAAAVIAAPFPYGVPKRHETKFFQVAMLNVARLRFLARARAVLPNIDIDELVAPMPGTTVFEATARGPLGYRLFAGEWRERPAQAAAVRAPRHRDHTERPARALSANTKYCIAPGGLLGWSHWDVHGAVRGFLKDRLVTRASSYWHCRNINTGWQHDRSATAGEDAATDAATAAALARVFDADARPSAPSAGR